MDKGMQHFERRYRTAMALTGLIQRNKARKVDDLYLGCNRYPTVEGDRSLEKCDRRDGCLRKGDGR